MGNFSIKEDLLKLKGAFITNFKGARKQNAVLSSRLMTAGFMSGKKAFI